MEGVFYYQEQWLEEAPKILTPMNHAFWMASVVFDGARVFNGLIPDIDQHCRRLINSAHSMLLSPTKTAAEVEALSREAARRFEPTAELYIRPMFFAMEGFVAPESDSTEFCLSVYRAPLPDFSGIAVCLSSRRRPARDMAPTDAKAGCLYPNSARALREAEAKGFANAVILDANGNVAEFATSNLWIVKDGIAKTPAINGAFLNGVTRQRVIKLLNDDGIPVEETTLTFDDVMAADEIFSTGNHAKVTPITRIEDRELQPGHVVNRARELYWQYAKAWPLFD